MYKITMNIEQKSGFGTVLTWVFLMIGSWLHNIALILAILVSVSTLIVTYPKYMAQIRKWLKKLKH